MCSSHFAAWTWNWKMCHCPFTVIRGEFFADISPIMFTWCPNTEDALQRSIVSHQCHLWNSISQPQTPEIPRRDHGVIRWRWWSFQSKAKKAITFWSLSFYLQLYGRICWNFVLFYLVIISKHYLWNTHIKKSSCEVWSLCRYLNKFITTYER